MTGKTRNLVISLITLMVIVGAFLFTRLKDKQEVTLPTAAPQAPEILSDFTVTSLRSITVESSDKKMYFYSPDGENWMISDVSDNYRIVKDQLAAEIRTLSKLQSRTVVTGNADEAQLTEYGLNPPEVLITFKDIEGKTLSVEVGKANPSGTSRYSRLSGSPTVVLLPSYAAGAVFKSVEDFRDISLPAVNMEKLSNFEFRHNGTTFKIAPRNVDDNYTSMVSPFDITSPFRNHYALDSQTFQKILGEETPLPSRVKEFLDSEDSENPMFGLDENNADYLKLADEDGNVLNLIIGSEDGQGNRYTRFGDHEDSLFLLSDSNLAVLNTDPFRFMSKFVFLGSIFQVSQVKVERGAETWIMKRTERGEPENTDDDRFIANNLEVPKKEFTSVYQKFISIMYEGEVKESRSLKTPEVRITISNVKSEIEPRVIRYWPYNDTYYQVSIDSNPIEFLVGRYQVEDFIEDLAALSEYGS